LLFPAFLSEVPHFGDAPVHIVPVCGICQTVRLFGGTAFRKQIIFPETLVNRQAPMAIHIADHPSSSISSRKHQLLFPGLPDLSSRVARLLTYEASKDLGAEKTIRAGPDQ
jgi:hypothetical protein